MDKSSGILDVIFCVISFRRAIRVGLMAVVLFTAGCSSSPVQTAVVATTTPDATATATIEPTPTAVPTPTIVPKPDYINNDNSVQTDGGTVFIKDGKYMLYDAKTGEIREIKDISTVAFEDGIDVMSILEKAHEAELSSTNKEDFLPEGFKDEAGYYSNRLVTTWTSGVFDTGTIIETVGTVMGMVKTKNPVTSSEFTEVGYMALRVYGTPHPVLVAAGVFKNEKFYSFYNEKGLTGKSLKSASWDEFKAVVKGQVLDVYPYFALDPKSATITDDINYANGFDDAIYAPEVAIARRDLMTVSIGLAKVAGKIWVDESFKVKRSPGEQYEAALKSYVDAGGRYPFYFNRMDMLVSVGGW